MRDFLILKTPKNEMKWKTTKLNDHIKNKMSLEQISHKILNKIFHNYFIWQDEGFSHFKNNINEHIRNRKKTIILTFNPFKKRIKGVFLGLGDDGCLQVQVGNRTLDYYSVESITFPVDDLL